MSSNKKSPEPPEEILRCVDEEGKDIEPHTRLEVHKLPLRYWQAVTGIFVVNSKSEILCSKRSEKLTQRSGKWQHNFGGHVKAGQSFLENAIEELHEESGIKADPEKIIFLHYEKNFQDKHYGYHCLYLLEDKDIKFKSDDGEITEYKWMPLEEQVHHQNKFPNAWANHHKEAMQKIKDWLKNNV